MDNVFNTKDDKTASTSMAGLYGERSVKLTTNGHVMTGETSDSLRSRPKRRLSADSLLENKLLKRINPLRLHLGKRPFVGNHPQNISIKRQKPNLNALTDINALYQRQPVRAPKLIRKNHLHNVLSQPDSSVDNEQDKPVPLLVPKSQLLQYKQLKKSKAKVPPLKEYVQSLGLQPMMRYKCRKCSAVAFDSLVKLKEHQSIHHALPKHLVSCSEFGPQVESNVTSPITTKKLFLCSSCGAYFHNWDLFTHMKEIHNRHICLFCLGMFSKANKLSMHLTNKHHVQEINFENEEEFYEVFNEPVYMMCCTCDTMYDKLDDFFHHDCNKVIPKPVPVLVSKNTAKPIKNINVSSTVTHKTTDIDHVCSNDSEINKKEDSDMKSLFSNSKIPLRNEDDSSKVLSSDTSYNSEHSVTTSKDATLDTTDVSEEENLNVSQPSPEQKVPSIQGNYTDLPNGEERVDQTNGPCSPHSTETTSAVKSVYYTLKRDEPIPPSVPQHRENEGGIKLKLSLNNANSPVIINSTVDPTVGQQNTNKPPTRVRRPPKRYETEKSKMPPIKMTICDKSASPFVKNVIQEPLLEHPIQQKMPPIKMTICDKSVSSFVKNTVHEFNEDTKSQVLINNNLDSDMKTPDYKAEKTIKSTIYDNKFSDNSNTLNRVPKLTVRLPKELLDKDSSTDYSSDDGASDILTVEENNTTIAHTENKENIEQERESQLPSLTEGKFEISKDSFEESQKDVDPMKEDIEEAKNEFKEDIPDEKLETKVEEKVTADEIPVIELSLDKPIDQYPLKDLLKVFLSTTTSNCIYCNHVRKIAVNCKQLALHMVAQHRFSATVNSITEEELLPETIVAKLKASSDELSSIFINLDLYDSVDGGNEVPYDHLFECFQCYFKTPIHKDLYLHNRKMHQKTILLCVMCKSNFYTYSELLCHLCPGTYDSEYEMKFRCCLCNVDTIPSSFRLMVHLRKIHHTCDVCIEFCYSQARLSNHVWKHKLHHLCYRCGIAYRNKPDITKHLFWKHGTESIMCKRCLQKKWPHVYHFCSPPAAFVCEECSLQFTKAVYLKVHKRFHSGEFPHVCSEESCGEKFVSKKLLIKHIEQHKRKLFIEDMTVDKQSTDEPTVEICRDIPVTDLIGNSNEKQDESIDVKENENTAKSKKVKKKKLKDKDALLLDVNLPELNLSESDSSDDSDGGIQNKIKEEKPFDEKLNEEPSSAFTNVTKKNDIDTCELEMSGTKSEDKVDSIDEKPNDEKVLQIWDNFKKYQAKVEKNKEKTPPLVPIRKHVCESDHDYCLVPVDLNGDEDTFSFDKKKIKKSPKAKYGDSSSSSSSSSDSDSSCSCGSNCSCSSSSGSSSSSSSGSDSSDESDNEDDKKKNKKLKKATPHRRMSNGSNVDVMGMSETPILVPEKTEPLVAESDLETDESDTDEEFYDEHPQQLANKLHAEKRNQLMLLASVAPSDGGSMSGDVSRPTTPVKQDVKTDTEVIKSQSSKKKSKKKKKSKYSKKADTNKLNIPRDLTAKFQQNDTQSLAPNKITISLQTNTVQMPETAVASPKLPGAINNSNSSSATDRKRASKRRRVPNKFYGYSSDEESTTPNLTPLKPQPPPKLEWKKEDLPSPVTHKPKKEVPSSTIPQRLYNYSGSRFATPIPDPEPPKILMNTESMDSSDSDSSNEPKLEMFTPAVHTPAPAPPPSYLNSGTSSLPYAFQRPAVRQAREGESVYCYCRCPYDEVSEMIGCDAEGCPIEWFHFECVGIMVPPKGKWYCPECRKNQSLPGYR